MRYLHGCISKFSHGRLNPGTIFVDQSWRAKISDYGLPLLRVNSYNTCIDNNPGSLYIYRDQC